MTYKIKTKKMTVNKINSKLETKLDDLPSQQSSKGIITIVGAGPVGALLAVILARGGYKVNLFESRADSRKFCAYQGKSINIALSERGWLALKSVGIEQKIRQKATPMRKRVVHSINGAVTEQAYGDEGQAIWSVSRAYINEQLLELAENEPLATLNFKQRLVQVNFITGCATFSHHQCSQEVHCDYLFAADGAYSKVRRLAQETPRFSYNQSFMPQCYIELTIPANKDGCYQLEKEALHLWPRKDFMLIALPNADGSFTCTLFLNHQGDISFASLTNREDVVDFFDDNFSDVVALLVNPVDEFMEKAANPLFLVDIDPWVINNKIALIGDAAHTMMPFYGQGMNCGFEDCRELAQLITKYQDNWSEIFPAYQDKRKINADAITELTRQNYIEMSKHAADPLFQIQKKIETKFHQQYPELWTPLYAMVTFFPQITYATALALGHQQQKIMDDIMQIPNITQCWQDEFIYHKLLKLVKKARLKSVNN